MPAARSITPATYVTICGILIALTLLTLGVSFIHMHAVWHVVITLLIATCKASLVVLFFMHVWINPRLPAVVVVVTVFWVGILLVLTLTDYFTRDMIPFVPGH